MAEGVVQLPADGSGKKLRTVELTVGGNTVEQEVVTSANSDGTLVELDSVAGTFGYSAGSSGTVTPANGAKVRGITCHATTAGTVVIKAGASIPVPANTTFFDSPEKLVGDGSWTIVFTGTDSYFVRYLV